MTKNSRRKKSTRTRASAQGINFTQASDNSHRTDDAGTKGIQLRLNERFMSDALREKLRAPDERERLAAVGIALIDAEPALTAADPAASRPLDYVVGPSPVIGGQTMPISFQATPHLVVTGPARSGKTSWLDSFVRQTRDSETGLRASVDIIDLDGNLAARWAGRDAIRTASSAPEVAALLAEVMRDLRARQDVIHLLVASARDLLPRFVIIDGWDRLAAAPDVSEIFETIVALMRDGAERGVHVVLGSESLSDSDHRLARVLERADRFGSLSFGPSAPEEPLIAGRGHYRASTGSIASPIVMPGAEQPGDDDGLDPFRQRLGRLIRPANLDGAETFHQQERSIDETIERTFAKKQETDQRSLEAAASAPQPPAAPAPAVASWRYDRRQRITTIAAAAPAHSIDPRPLLRAVGTAIAVHYEPQTEQLDLHIDADGTCDFVLLGRESANEDAVDGGDFVIRDHTADELSTHLTDAERAAVERWMRDAWAYLNDHFLAFNDLWATVAAALRRGEPKVALDVDLGWRPLGNLDIRHDVNATPTHWARGNVIRRYRDGRYRYFAEVLPLTAEGEYLGSGATGGIGVTTADGIDHEQLQFFHQQAFSLDTAQEEFEFTLVHAALSLPTPNI